MIRNLLLFLCLMPFVFLIGEDDTSDPFSSSLTNTQSLLPTTVQSISTISGEWLESEVDLVVKGPEPLVCARSYSAQYSSGHLGYSWDFTRSSHLYVEKKEDHT